MNKLFKKGDFITVGSDSGSIVDINFLFTTIMTADNKKITIPNSSIVNSSVVNAGANPKRRVDFTFSVAYETDVETVKRIVTEVMTSNGKIDFTDLIEKIDLDRARDQKNTLLMKRKVSLVGHRMQK